MRKKTIVIKTLCVSKKAKKEEYVNNSTCVKVSQFCVLFYKSLLLKLIYDGQ